MQRHQQFHSPTIASAPPLHISALWKGLAASKYYYKHSFELTDSKGLRGPMFKDHTFSTVCCRLGLVVWRQVAKNKALLIRLSVGAEHRKKQRREQWTNFRHLPVCGLGSLISQTKSPCPQGLRIHSTSLFNLNWFVVIQAWGELGLTSVPRAGPKFCWRKCHRR